MARTVILSDSGKWVTLLRFEWEWGANQRLETCYEPIHVDVWRTNLRLSNGAIYTKFFTDSTQGVSPSQLQEPVPPVF